MTQSNISGDAHTMMMFEANKKSAGLAFALWLFLGMIGAHRFYAGRTGTGILMLVLFVIGAAALPVGGVLLLIGDGIWTLIDAFQIGGWIRDYNMQLISRISGGADWQHRVLGDVGR